MACLEAHCVPDADRPARFFWREVCQLSRLNGDEKEGEKGRGARTSTLSDADP
jgi:hypothetical protein